MSSARNHAKRSHRSEYAKRSCIGSSTRRAYIKQVTMTKRVSLFEMLFHRGHKAKETTN